MSEYKNSIVLGIKLDDINKVKSDLQKQIDGVKGISAKIDTATFDVTKLQSSIQTQLNSMNFTFKINNVDVSGIDNVINKTKQATKEAEQFKNVMGKSLNIGDGAKAFDDLQKRANEIKNTVDSLAKIDFNTTKNGGIKDATITYTDNMGKLVTETMKWKQVMSETEGVVKNIFTTTNVKVTDNVQQLGKLESRIDSIKSKMQNKLNTASVMGIDSATISSLQSQLNSINVNTPISKINELRNQINSIGGNSTTNINKLESAINSLGNRINNIKSTKMDIIKDNDISELKTAENEVNRLKELLSQVKSGKIIDGKLISSEINTARNSVNQLSTAINGVKANASALGTAFSNIFNYAIGGSVIFAGLNQLKQGLVDIKNIDTAMRDLKRVADDVSQSSLNNFTNEANDMAKSLGNTTESVIQAVASFKQLGYTWEQSKDFMAKESIILSNVGDMSAKDSADAIVATLKGFRLEAQDTVKVVDSLNEAGNKFAIRTGELAEGLRVSSASLALAGNDLYKSEALITAGTEVLRDANGVGVGLKTISMRLDQVKSKGGETFFKLKNDLKELANTDLTNADGSLRSTYDLIIDINKAWSSGNLSDMDKAKILDDVAGKNQAKVLAGIIQNAEKLPQIYETLKNSAGSAEQEQARFMDSLEGKLNALKESVKAIWINLSDTNSLKNIVSGSTGVVNGLNAMIQKFGAMPTVIMGVVGAMTLFNAEFRKSMSSYQPTFLTNWIKGLNSYKTTLSETAKTAQTHITGLQRLISVQNASGASTIGAKAKLAEYQAQLALATIGTKALQVATMTLEMAFSMGISLVISGVIGKIMDLANAQANLKQSNDEYVKSLQQNNPTNHQALLDNYKKLQSELAILKVGTAEYKEKEQELAGVQEQLISLYPQATDVIDKNTGKKQLNAKVTQDLIDKEKQYAQAEAIKKLSENDVKSTEDIKKLADGYKKATDEMKKYQEMYNNGQRTLIRPSKNGKGLDQIDISKEIEKSKQSSESYLSKLSALQGALGIVEDKSGKYAGAIDIINNALGISLQKTEKDTKGKIDNSEKIKLASNAVKEFKSNSDSLSTDTIDKLNKAYPSLGINAENASQKVEELNKLVDDADDTQAQAQAKAIQEASKAYADASKQIAQAEIYLQKLNKAQAVTPTLAKQMQKTYGDSVATIDSVSEAQEFLTKKIQEQKEIEAENYLEMNAMDENFYQQKLVNSDEFKNAYQQFLNAFNSDGEQAYEIDFGNYKNYADLKNGTQKDFGVAIENWLSQYVGESAQGYSDDFQNFKTIAEQKASVLKKLNDEIKKINANLAGAESLKTTIADHENFNSIAGIDSTYDPLSIMNKDVSSRIDDNEAKWKAQIEKLQGAVQEVDTNFDNFGASLKGFSGGSLGGTTDFGAGKSGGSGSKGREKKDYSQEIADLKSDIKPDRYLDLNNAVKALDSELEVNKSLQDALEKGSKEYRDSQLKEIDLDKQKQEALSKLNVEQNKEAKEMKDRLASMSFQFDANGKLINSQQRLLEMQESINAESGDTEEAKKQKESDIKWLKDLQKYTEDYTDLVGEKIPKTTAEWNKLGNEIKSTTNEMEKADEEALQKLRENLVNGLKKEREDEKDKKLNNLEDEYNKKKDRIQKEYDNEKQRLEDEKEAEQERYEKQIKALQKQLNDLDEAKEDKQGKLAELQKEYNQWGLDNSSYAKKNRDELAKEIKDLQIDIQKDSINKQIDSLNEQKENSSKHFEDELKEIDDYYKKELDNAEKHYNKMKQRKEDHYKDQLDEKKLYAKADELITSNSNEEMLKILNDSSESYKQVGSLLGENFKDAFLKQIQEAIDALKDLQGMKAKKESNSSSSSSNSSSNSNSGNVDVGSNVWLDDAEDNEIYSDASHENSKGTGWDNGIASGDELKVADYDNGFMRLEDSNGNDLGWVERDKLNRWNDTATYSTGGRTPNNIPDSGANAILHKNEKILNADETLKFDELYNYIKSSGGLLTQLSATAMNPSQYMVSTMGTDLSHLTNGLTNNNTTVTGDTNVKFENHFSFTGEYTREKSNDIIKQLTDQLGYIGNTKLKR